MELTPEPHKVGWNNEKDGDVLYPVQDDLSW